MSCYRLIACDLDGTLVSSDLTVSEQNKKAISRLGEMGICFVPCTGRTLSEMREITDNPDIRYIIYSNGAAIWDKVTGENTFLGFSSEVAFELMDILSQFDCYIIVHYRGEAYIDTDMTEENVKKYNISFNVKKLIREFANKTENLKKTVCDMEGIESVTVFFKNIIDTENFKRIISDSKSFSFADGWKCNVEVFRSDTSKGSALSKICEILGIDISETITIGDSGNDKSMTVVSGLGLAVSNATENLKEVADEIICSNDENVMEYVLNRYFL